METKDLFTIGKLSKITGVHVKSLRYYERIGILPPTYRDPDNGYRYYSPMHIQLVFAIKFCTELNIPLSEFNNFISKDGTELTYLDLVRFATDIANQKMKDLQMSLDELNNMLEHMENEDSDEGFQELLTIPANDYWTFPFEGNLLSENYHSSLMKIYHELDRLGLYSKDYEDGMLLIRHKESISTYIFVKLEKKEENKQFDSILSLPKLNFKVSRTKDVDIHNAPKKFPKLFNQEYDQYVFQTELIAKRLNLKEPMYEIRSSLPVLD